MKVFEGENPEIFLLAELCVVVGGFSCPPERRSTDFPGFFLSYRWRFMAVLCNVFIFQQNLNMNRLDSKEN